MITNGTLVSDSNLHMIYDTFSAVVVSLDSHRHEINDYYRGKGTCKTVMENIKRLVSCGLRVEVNITLTSRSIESADETSDILRDIGVA